jgi:chromosome segregation ATPase
VAELLEAGDALRGAQDQVLAGRGDGGSLRAAVEQERTAVDELTGAARGLLSSEGHDLSPTIIERVTDTLHAAALDDDARAQVQDGRLERELRHVGLGIAAVGPVPARAPARPKKQTADRAAAQQAEREQAEAKSAARATEREARRRLERAERAANSAAERRDRAARALEEAEAELSDAEAELEGARDELGTAEQAVRELGR